MATPTVSVPPKSAQPHLRTYQGTTITSFQEMAECLLLDFARRAQQDEDGAYQRYRRFIDSSERVMQAHHERRTRRVQ